MEHFRFIVAPDECGGRLDNYCASKLPQLTRSQLKARLSKITVNGINAKFSKKLAAGDQVCLALKPKVQTFGLFPYHLAVCYEDENIIVIKKPSGMVTHPAAGHYTHTLVNALEYYRRNVSNIIDSYSLLPLTAAEQPFRPGIVHRLDKDTSGLMLTVRNDEAKRYYISTFKKRAVKKYYLAIIDKPLPAVRGHITTQIMRSPKNRQKFIAVAGTQGKQATTAYKVLKRYGKFSLVLFRIYTGRTHQIRVHCKYLHTGIVGDPLYNGDKKNRLMLHAVQLQFTDQNGVRHTFKTKIPKRFYVFLQKLKTQNV